MKITDVVRNKNIARFSFFRQGLAYYNVDVAGITYVFPINVADLEHASIFRDEKAIMLMKHIKKAMDAGTFVRGA